MRPAACPACAWADAWFPIQTALSLLLLVGAGLFVRTVVNLYRVDTGFDTDRLLVFKLDGRKTGLEGPRLVDCYEQIRTSIAGLPGVQAVASSNILLLSRWMNNSQAKIPGHSQDEGIAILGLSVSDSFLSTMGIPLLLGRDLSPADDGTARKVILVNQTLARRAFPDENPVGRVLTINQNDYEIVGVFGDITYADLKRAVEPTVFYSYRQTGGQISRMFYEVRTAADPLALVPAHPEHRIGRGPQSPDGGHQDPGDPARRIHRAGAVLRHAGFGPGADGGAALLHRPLRPDGLQRVAPHGRDRDSHGPGR